MCGKATFPRGQRAALPSLPEWPQEMDLEHWFEVRVYELSSGVSSTEAWPDDPASDASLRCSMRNSLLLHDTMSVIICEAARTPGPVAAKGIDLSLLMPMLLPSAMAVSYTHLTLPTN